MKNIGRRACRHSKQTLNSNLWRELAELAALVAVAIFCAVLFSGCAAKPNIITKTEFQKVIVPVRCEVELPQKPNFDPENLVSAQELAAYYAQIEVLLIACTKEEEQ